MRLIDQEYDLHQGQEFSLTFALITYNHLFAVSISVHHRHGLVQDWIKRIDDAEGGLDSFSKAYTYYGLHMQPDNSVIAREWAPGAQQLYLTGDFSEYLVRL